MTGLAGLPALATTLINKYGTAFTHTQTLTGEYDSSIGQKAAIPQKQTLKSLPDEYADSIRFLGSKLQTGTTIQEGDKKMTVPATDLKFVYKIGDVVTQLDQTFTIMGIAKAVAVGNVVYYVLHLRS